MTHLGLEVENIDDDGGRGHNAFVGNGRQPTRPPAFGSARDDETVDRSLPLVGGQGLDGVHGFHGTLDHGEQERPGGVARFQITEPGFGNQVVLDASAEERLVGHLAENGHATAGHLCQRQSSFHVAIARAFAIAATTHEKQHVVGVLHIHRFEDLEHMFPDDPLPLLRRKIDVVNGAVFRRDFATQFPAVNTLGRFT